MHYNDVIMDSIASQITSLTIVYSAVYSGADQRKHQSSASLAFVRGIHRGPANSPHKWPVTRKMFPFDDVIMMVCHFFQGRGVRGPSSWIFLGPRRNKKWSLHACYGKLSILFSRNSVLCLFNSLVQNQIWQPKFWLPNLVSYQTA